MNNIVLKMYVNLVTGFKSRKGQAMSEYGLIIALVAVVLLGVISALTGVLKEVFEKITTAISSILHPTANPPG